MKNLIQGYKLTSDQPLDDRLVVQDDSARLSLPVIYSGLRVFQLSNRTGWSWDGVSWTQDIGPQGPQGVTGTQGLTGSVTGQQGITGQEGLPGILIGLLGNTGPQGLQSNLTGTRGPQGLVGIQGTQGVSGPQGITGSQGPQGFIGTEGFQGLRGSTGPQGFIGPQGNMGQIGLTGERGVTGSQGFTGPQGTIGSVGNQGSTGPQGTGGSLGLTGTFARKIGMTQSIDWVDSWGMPNLINPTNHYDISLPASRRLTDGTPVIVDNIYDDDSSYDTTTGIWTCPQTGIYDISFSVTIRDLTSAGIGDVGYVIIAGITDPPSPGSGIYYTHDQVNTEGYLSNEVCLSGSSIMTPLCTGERLCLKITNILGYDLNDTTADTNTFMSIRRIKSLNDCYRCIPELDGITVTIGTRVYPSPTASVMVSQHFPGSYDSSLDGLSNRWLLDFPPSWSGLTGATLSIEFNDNPILGGPTSGGGGYWELIVATAGGSDIYAYSQTLLGTYHSLGAKSSPLYVSTYCNRTEPVCLSVDYDGDITNHTSYYGTVHALNYPSDPLILRYFTRDITDSVYPYYVFYDDILDDWTLLGGSTSLIGWNGATFGLSGSGFSSNYDALMTFPWNIDMTVTDNDAIPFAPHPNQNYLFSSIPNPPIGTFSIINLVTPTIGTWSVSSSQGAC